jgi:peptidoglycan/xylan/chitin deacetylase (PgdA/CDA1 family)
MSGERIKRAVKAILPRLLDGIGIYDRALASAEQTGAAWLVVMYHRVIRSTDSDPFRLGMCVTEQRFKEQVAFFADQFEPITVLEGVSRLRAGKRFPRRAVSITFDDGYRDNAEIAWPILRQRAMPMSLYVPSGIFQSHPHHWWDRVIHAVYTTSKREITLASVGMGGQDAVLNLSERQRGNAVRRILEMLWSQPIAGALASVAAIEACLQPPKQGATLPETVSIEQLKKLSQEGVEIGAHSVTHPNMRLLSDDEVAREVSESKQALEQLLGTPVAGFAYPSGFYDDRVVQAVRASQFQYAVSTEPGLNARSANPYLIERMGAPETNLADLKRCIANLAKQG